MGWLDYSDDEVETFHPTFESLAEGALAVDHLDTEFEWLHHVRTPASPLIPDFVLRRRGNRQWVVAVELKRTREAVLSARNQVQAKAYAETNQHLYAPNAPKYFVISNIEITLLHALNGDRPPQECRLQNGFFEAGDFQITPESTHRERFREHLRKIIQVVRTAQPPVFDTVWPRILAELLAYSTAAAGISHTPLAEPRTPNWRIVRDYFASGPDVDSARLLFLRCLMAEYLRGFLLKYQHPRATAVPPAAPNLEALATTIASLQQIDFRILFEAHAPSLYRDITDSRLRELLTAYLNSLFVPGHRVVELAATRVDAPDLVDSVLNAVYPPNVQDESGKVRTDPELAALLASVTIRNPAGPVLDPCCGDGVLLSAAYQTLVDKGMRSIEAFALLKGIEADPVALRLAEVRLALKQTSALQPEPALLLTFGDMFAHPELIDSASVILMNPPFKRYEDQDGRPVPPGLRAHYNVAIRSIGGHAPMTTGGQSNLFHHYVEFVIKAVHSDAMVGIVLDNKWYHNGYGSALRRLLLERCEILGIIEYPHWAFFAYWTIATSLLVVRRVDRKGTGHRVKFVRVRGDPRGVDLRAISSAFHEAGPWPLDWKCREKEQGELKFTEGWKKYFGTELAKDYRLADWPLLPDLFEFARRGSLAKEGGGVQVYEFPFERSDYGPRRRRRVDGSGFRTTPSGELTASENRSLAELAARVPSEYRGWALKNSDRVEHYELAVTDVEKDQTLEPPSLRQLNAQHRGRRSTWTADHDLAVTEMRAHPAVGRFIAAIETTVGLDDTVLERKKIWNVLREPVAGELIVPRKTRIGHRVYVNPFAFNPHGRQVRISSNFIGFGGCLAADTATELDRHTATSLICAFLVSSFGQLQFEMEGYNREGLLSMEEKHLDLIRVFDPRWIRREQRRSILDTFSSLPHPIPSNRRSAEIVERNRLDALFAAEIANRYPEFNEAELLADVHDVLDEWLEARQP